MMEQVIDEIEKAIATVGFEGVAAALSRSTAFIWEEAYPIAVVHSGERIEEEAVKRLFREHGLLDEEGFTPERYSKSQLKFIAENAPQYLQRATLMCLNEAPSYPRLFKSKYPKDYWKKMQDVDPVKSVVEPARFTAEDTRCSVEFALREVMRKRKEVNLLKQRGYVWIAEIPEDNDIEEVMRHYFQENHSVVCREGMAYHIGWNAALNAINMRYFVCPPG